MTGVHHFFVEDRGYVRISSTAQTAQLENRTYIDVTEPGNTSLANIIVKKGGTFDLVRHYEVIIQVTSTLFEIKYEGKVLMNHGVIYSSVGDLETKGELIMDGRGWDSGTGLGKGSRYHNYGTGAGHGGRGGTNGGTSGEAYDSVFKPLMLGSGGGEGRYGPGGKGIVQTNLTATFSTVTILLMVLTGTYLCVDFTFFSLFFDKFFLFVCLCCF